MSAVKNAGNFFNTGLMLIHPMSNMFYDLLASFSRGSAYNQGEQGFLNWFFRQTKVNSLPSRFGGLCQYSKNAIWPEFRQNINLYHFNGLIKPWNFFLNGSADVDWERFLDPTTFYSWMRIHREASKILGTKQFSVAEDNWTNIKRVERVCDSTKYNPRKMNIHYKFSVLIGTWDRISMVLKLIQHYRKSTFVHRIFVTLHNPVMVLPEELLELSKDGKQPAVEFLFQEYDSLNNRFNPIENLETEAILVCDDDVLVSISDIEYAFEVWRNRKNSLVGVFPRYHYWSESTAEFVYDTLGTKEIERSYSIMLTKLMFMKSDFLFIYTCLLPPLIHKYVDSHLNCEDIAMNMMVSGLTGFPPVSVKAVVEDYGTDSGISWKPGHLQSRSQCISDLVKIFKKDTLLTNSEFFMKYRASTAL